MQGAFSRSEEIDRWSEAHNRAVRAGHAISKGRKSGRIQNLENLG
jgi:hypothetical protein